MSRPNPEFALMFILNASNHRTMPEAHIGQTVYGSVQAALVAAAEALSKVALKNYHYLHICQLYYIPRPSGDLGNWRIKLDECVYEQCIVETLHLAAPLNPSTLAGIQTLPLYTQTQQASR